MLVASRTDQRVEGGELLRRRPVERRHLVVRRAQRGVSHGDGQRKDRQQHDRRSDALQGQKTASAKTQQRQLTKSPDPRGLVLRGRVAREHLSQRQQRQQRKRLQRVRQPALCKAAPTGSRVYSVEGS